MSDYLIQTQEGEHHRLCVERQHDYDGKGTHPLIYISTNNRTMGMSIPMAEELLKALLAVLKGGFDRALSESSLRMEQEELSRRTTRTTRSQSDSATSHHPKPVAIKPELDML